jgi:hypothetical protein
MGKALTKKKKEISSIGRASVLKGEVKCLNHLFLI